MLDKIMSLFVYTGHLADGKEKTGKVTAKSEKEARVRITTEHKVVDLRSVEVQDDSARTPKSAPKPKTLSKLQKMLYLQHGRCFFCGEVLPESEASIEHLNPKAKGGTSTEDNEVVCHVSLNQAFGSMDLKRKFEFILRQGRVFKCPS